MHWLEEGAARRRVVGVGAEPGSRSGGEPAPRPANPGGGSPARRPADTPGSRSPGGEAGRPGGGRPEAGARWHPTPRDLVYIFAALPPFCYCSQPRAHPVCQSRPVFPGARPRIGRPSKA